MKQAKKMLCMLLVMLLAFSTVSIGVSAAYTSYATPTSYDIHETPVLSTKQRSSQLLDFVDAMLYDMRDDLYIDITIMTLDFTSVDNALDTIKGLKSAANLIGGDVGDLDIDALGTTRRATAGKTDLDILYELLYFLNANRGIVGNFVRGELDLGIIKSFVSLDFDIYQEIVNMLYESMVDETVDTCPSGWTADSILQHYVDTMLLGGTAPDGDVQDALLPSMAGKTNINTQTIWAIIENAANAATKDLLIPFIKNDLGALLDEAKAANPHPAWDYINISNLNLDSYVWGQYDSTNGIIAEINHLIYYVLDQVWTGDPFWVDGSNDKLQQNLEATLKILYKELGELILPASSEFLPQDEIEAMDLQQLVVYIAKQFLQAEMPYILWGDSYGEELPLDNIGQLACYVAYSILADLSIDTSYMESVENGYDEYGPDYALSMIADIGAYYLNGALTVKINYGEGVEMLLTKLVDWALADTSFGGFFKGCGISQSDSCWTKIDKTVLTVLPLHKILGGGATGSYDLIMNKILGNLFELDIAGILELFYKADYSLLNKTIPQFAVYIVNNVLNIIVARNTQPAMISTSLTTIDQIIQNSNLGGTAERLLNGLYNAGQYQYFWDSLLPILNPILIDESEYSYNVITPPSGYGITTLEGLQAHIEAMEEAMDEPDDVYNMTATDWNEAVDYELWRYDKLEDAIDYGWDVVNGYNNTVEWVASANEELAAANASGDADAITAAQENLAEAQAELATYNAAKYANAAYEIDYYAEKAINDQNVAAKAHLQYLIYIIEYAREYNESDYPEDVWESYQTALDHAYTIIDTPSDTGDGETPNPELKQSMVNAARRNLLDAMRLLEVDLADLTALDAKLEEALAANTEGKTEDSVARLTALIEKAKEFLAESWTIDYQEEIDELVILLQEAIDGLADFVESILPELDKIKEDIKVAGEFVYNLATQVTPDELLAQFINSDENGTLEVETVVDGIVGTGSKLVLKDTKGEVVEEYEVVIFGDANGDGLVDIMDTICLDLYQANEVNYANGSAQWYALNLNADTSVDAADVILLDAYTNFEGEIDQGAIY